MGDIFEKMKIPQLRPGSQIFMVFSMMMAGLTLIMAIASVDYFMASDGYNIINVISGLTNAGIGSIQLSFLFLMSSISVGFLFYLISFFTFSAPVHLIMFVMMMIESSAPNFSGEYKRCGFFLENAPKILRDYYVNYAESRGAVRSEDFPIRYHAIVLYLLNSRRENQAGLGIRFVFTQVMFARAIGAEIIAFIIYVLVRINSDIYAYFYFIIPIWAIFIWGYFVGSHYLNDVLLGGYITNSHGYDGSKDN